MAVREGEGAVRPDRVARGADGAAPRRGAPRSGPAVWLAGALVLLLVAAALGLWARHGGAVFFDLLAAGIAGCF